MGVQVMTREHISIACALNIPMFVAVTKVDICPPNILKTTRTALAKLLRSNGKENFAPTSYFICFYYAGPFYRVRERVKVCYM